eukprot:Rhum_TRINITY_DN14861_c21_g1::Rhum_TRINITY_DN14861_c21_g1_i1::g.124417::m.124417
MLPRQSGLPPGMGQGMPPYAAGPGQGMQVPGAGPYPSGTYVPAPFVRRAAGGGGGPVVAAAAAAAAAAAKAQAAAVRPADYPIDYGMERVLRGGCDAATAVAGGLQAPFYLWTYVESTATPAAAAAAAGGGGPQEVRMLQAVAQQLAGNGVDASQIVVACATAAQHRLYKAEAAKATDSPAAAAKVVSLPTYDRKTDDAPFKWLLLGTVGPASLNRADAEYGLSGLLLAAAQQGAGVVIAASTKFLRAAESPECPEDTAWVSGWRKVVAQLRGLSFAVSGTEEQVPSAVGAQLPVCCPRHPSIRECAEEGAAFPADFCPYPCLSRYDGCGEESHLCLEGCHSGGHPTCPYLNAERLRCGHPNQSLCSEPADCGYSKESEMPCSHEEVVGYDSVMFRVRYATVQHKITLKCGEALEDRRCDHETHVRCATCGADRKVQCCHRVRTDDDGWAIDEDAAGPCPHCFALYNAICKNIKDKELARRNSERAEKEAKSLQLRLEQVEAAKKGIFVEGQRVCLRDPQYVENPERYTTVFGDLQWVSEALPKGAQGTVRARTHHADDLATLVYLVETQGQEKCIIAAPGLDLYNVVAELQGGQNVLMITAGAGTALEVGQWRPYAPEGGESGVFDAADFTAVPAVQQRGGPAAFYTPAEAPSAGRLFVAEEKLPHPDGSKVTVCLLRDIGYGRADKFLLATQAAFKQLPFQKGSKVLVANPSRISPSAGYHSFFPEVTGWFDGPVGVNDGGQVVGIINDGGNMSCYHYIVRLDVRRLHAVFHYRGLEQDEEAERMKKEDALLFERIEQLAQEEWRAQQETAREAYAQQRESDARHKEDTRATLAALAAKRKKEAEVRLMTAAERLKKEQETARVRDDGVRKRRRLDREAAGRAKRDVDALRRQHEDKGKDAPEEWTEKAVADSNVTTAAAAAATTTTTAAAAASAAPTASTTS